MQATTPLRVRLYMGIFCLLAAMPAPCATRASVSLDGSWQFRTDAGDAGRAGGWYQEEVAFPGSIRVPGCWQAEGIGEPSGILRNHYAGAAWYRRRIEIPSEWSGRRIVLRIGGALRDVELFVNGKPAGKHRGMSAPFEFDVTSVIKAGAENVLALRVAIPKGSPDTASPDAQKGAEPTGMVNYVGNWGGIYGHVELIATDSVRIEDVAILPSVSRMAARFRIAVAAGGQTPRAATLRVTVADESGRYEASAPVEIRDSARTEREIEVRMPRARLWSPEHPALYTAEIRLDAGGRERDRMSQRFGMREVSTRGDVLLLNGKPLYLRGFGDDNIEVLSGTPPASKETYLQRLRLAKSFGFNAVRFHSMTPLEDYFEAADETGILVMAELPAAYTMYFLPHKEFLRNELTEILRAHRNHPSFLSIAFGNELNPAWISDSRKRQEFLDSIGEFYRLAKSIDPVRVVMATDGILLRPTDMVSVSGTPAKDVPTVRHEFGTYYCSLPDISLIPKFTGVVAPAWLEAKRDWVKQKGLDTVYPGYVTNSQRLQQLGRKYQIETVRLNNSVTGYHYWLIVDYPGGTGEGDSWEEGWFDYFWTPKGIAPEDGRELNSAVLPLIDAGPGDRSLWADTGKTISALISNYGDEEIRNGVLKWRVVSGGRPLASAEIPGIHVPLGKVSRVGEIVIPPLPHDQARQLDLVVEIEVGSSVYRNHWSLYSFPRAALLKQSALPVFSNVQWESIRRVYPFVNPARSERSPNGLVVTATLDHDVIAHLNAGGRVLLLDEKGELGARGDLTYFPTQGAAIGTKIEAHPALEGFPHADFGGMQFYNLLERAGAVPLDRLPAGTVPIVGAIRTATGWLSQKKDLAQVAYLFEARVGRGKLLATTFRIRENFDEAFPETMYLFDRLLRYAVSDAFNPKTELGAGQLVALE